MSLPLVVALIHPLWPAIVRGTKEKEIFNKHKLFEFCQSLTLHFKLVLHLCKPNLNISEAVLQLKQSSERCDKLIENHSSHKNYQPCKGSKVADFGGPSRSKGVKKCLALTTSPICLRLLDSITY